jgi:hypothetical protein
MTFAKVEDYCLFNKVIENCRKRELPDFFHTMCLPLFSGIAAFAQQDWAKAVRAMSPVLKRPQLRVGGSKLQQSIFHSTLDVAIAFCAVTNRTIIQVPTYPLTYGE